MDTEVVQLELTLIEQTSFKKCEERIAQGLKTFVAVGEALLQIRDQRLYRKDWRTFEEYCRGRWGWERRHAYRIMDAASVAQNVSHGTHLSPSVVAVTL